MPCHRLSSYGRRAFSVAGPAIWNWLPDSLRYPAISRDSFKRSLKTFLFSAYSCTERIRAFWTMRSTNLLTDLDVNNLPTVNALYINEKERQSLTQKTQLSSQECV